MRRRSWLDDFVYDIMLWISNVVVDLFFREVHPRASYRIPRRSPVIFVAAPHANQFVDPLILGSTVRHDAKRRISFLIAEKSMRRKFIGLAASLVGSVSVGRALDLKKPAQGKIYLPDPDSDPTLVKGKGTQFDDKNIYMPGGLLVLPSVNNASANTEIKEILGPDEIRLKHPFAGDVAFEQLTGRTSNVNGNGNASDDEAKGSSDFEGTKFSVAPHVDQSKVYERVFKKIKDGGCIGIFPEGGSHDRTELLPLKAGLAIMALGALAEDPDCGVTIVPVGMNYFHPHKFRSRAVIEFGKPITVDPELVQQYKNGNRRDAISRVLDTVYKGLQTVTTLAPDYDTLMLIQAVRRLYNSKGKELPLSMVVELNRRLMKGYATYKDDPRVVKLRKDVLDYNRTLFGLNLRDHQVGYAKHPWWKVMFLLTWRVLKISALSIAVLPGTVLFAPVFIAGKIISIRKSKEALAASTVKIKARDVMATWKILVALALTPILDVTYTSLLTWWTYYNRVGGRVPLWIPLWSVYVFGLIFFPAMCFMALRFGEVGMDIFKSLRPLFLSINPSSSNSLVQLSKRREQLAHRIDDLINDLGPELFPDFDRMRIVPDQEDEDEAGSSDSAGPATPAQRRDGSDIDVLNLPPPTPPGLHFQPLHASSIPRNESFKNIGSVGLFASRPGTPHTTRSRSNSGSEPALSGTRFGSGLRGFTAMHEAAPVSKPDLEEVSRNLHAAMRERGRRRTSDAEGWVEFERTPSPTSETDGEGLRMGTKKNV